MDEAPSQSGCNQWSHLLIDLLLLTLVWLLSLLIVNPAGNFPLNDDWSYGLTVKHLLTTGDYRPTGWESMTLAANVLWGSLFCLPAGFSFTALRLSTLAASWLGMIGIYWLMKEIRQERSIVLVAAFTFAFNPIYYALSNTFMTDVLYITLTIFAAIFFLKNLKTNSHSSLFLGTAFSLAAVLSRQVGLAIPLAFAITSIWQHGFKTRALLRALIPLGSCVVVLIVFQHWLAVTGRLPALFNLKNQELFDAIHKPVKTIGIFTHGIYLCLMYLGLLLSPFLIFNFSRFGLSQKKTFVRAGWFLAALTGLTVINGFCSKGFVMPLSTNIIDKSGIGPLTLRDTFMLHSSVPVLPGYFWVVITIISLTGAAILINQVIATIIGLSPQLFSFKLQPEESSVFFLLLIPLIYLPLFFVNGFFDRYLIPVIPFLIAALVIRQSQIALKQPMSAGWATALLLAGFFIFSVAGTKDYLTWNRTRWTALNNLMKDDAIKPSAIDGGFEFNGYYLYDPEYKVDPKKSDWWVNDDLYLIAFNPVPGYAVQRAYPYTHWLPPYHGNIYVLKRIP